MMSSGAKLSLLRNINGSRCRYRPTRWAVVTAGSLWQDGNHSHRATVYVGYGGNPYPACVRGDGRLEGAGTKKTTG